MTTWAEGATTIRSEQWRNLVLPDAVSGSPTFAVVAIHDLRYAEPLPLATPAVLTSPALRDLYRDRWPVEQIPLAAKQMPGAASQFVHAPKSCQRWPELTLLASALVSYLAATQPAVATGFWARQPQRTLGRLRQVLAGVLFQMSSRCRPEFAKTRVLRNPMKLSIEL